MRKLVIGDLVAEVPIVQGGMGVAVSMHKLAGAVAKEGGIGVISAAQPGFRDPNFDTNTMATNMEALAREIKLAKEISNGGLIGVNIMVALNGYEEYVKCCVESGADLIISGAGLPMDLPKYTEGTNIKIAPIVSSAKACKVIMQRWEKKNNRLPDLVVIEGPLAGGHLGFKSEEVENITSFDDEIKAVMEVTKEYAKKHNIEHIPVIFAGGVYDSEDIKHCFDLGLDGVQMATRFVGTEECDADIRFKEAYVRATKEDIHIVKSPVGMPGRAIYNDFIKKTQTEQAPFKRCYGCLHKCNPKEIPYCISQALFSAAEGDVNNALVFCGANAYKVDKITTVKAIMDELKEGIKDY